MALSKRTNNPDSISDYVTRSSELRNKELKELKKSNQLLLADSSDPIGRVQSLLGINSIETLQKEEKLEQAALVEKAETKFGSYPTFSGAEFKKILIDYSLVVILPPQFNGVITSEAAEVILKFKESGTLHFDRTSNHDNSKNFYFVIPREYYYKSKEACAHKNSVAKLPNDAPVMLFYKTTDPNSIAVGDSDVLMLLKSWGESMTTSRKVLRHFYKNLHFWSILFTMGLTILFGVFIKFLWTPVSVLTNIKGDVVQNIYHLPKGGNMAITGVCAILLGLYWVGVIADSQERDDTIPAYKRSVFLGRGISTYQMLWYRSRITFTNLEFHLNK